MSSLWRRHRKWLTPALLIAPAVVLFGAVVIASSAQSIWISLHEWDGFGPMRWLGLANYEELFRDPQFYVSLKNNVIWLVLSMVSIPLGLGIALLVNQKIRGMNIVKSLFFIPLVLATVAVGVVFTWVYTPRFGLLSLVFSAFGGEAPAVLSDPNLVTYAIVGAWLWSHTALCVTLYLAGLSGLNEDLIGAGRVDGARGWNMLRFVVLPQLSQMTFIAIALTAIGALRSFDMISVMTSGGPFGSSSVLAFQMFEQSMFSYRFGYGASIATILLVIMLFFIIWYLSQVLRSEGKTS